MVRTHLNRCGGFTEELFRYSSVKSNLYEAVDTQLQSVQLPLSRLPQAGLSEESRCLGRRALKRRVITGLFSTMDRGLYEMQVKGKIRFSVLLKNVGKCSSVPCTDRSWAESQK